MGEFSRRVPLILAQYRTDVDSIVLDLASVAITRTSVSTQCDVYQGQALQSLDLSSSNLGIKTLGGSVSASVVATYSAQLQDSIKMGKREKLDKYDEIVGTYNKTLLAGVTLPVIDKVTLKKLINAKCLESTDFSLQALANSYPNDGALNGDVDAAKSTFYAKARGDGTDRDTVSSIISSCRRHILTWSLFAEME